VSAYKLKLPRNIRYLWIYFSLYPRIYPRIKSGFQRPEANGLDRLPTSPPDMLTWNKARIFRTNAAVETSAA
jgi:hypothetical protein